MTGTGSEALPEGPENAGVAIAVAGPAFESAAEVLGAGSGLIKLPWTGVLAIAATGAFFRRIVAATAAHARTPTVKTTRSPLPFAAKAVLAERLIGSSDAWLGLIWPA